MCFLYKAIAIAAALVSLAAYGREPDPDSAGKRPSKLELAQGADAENHGPLAALLARAGELSRSGKAAEAYELLHGAEDTHIGAIEFDYALGRAALDAGHPDKATLAFARVLAQDPSHAGAAIDMGRAYLALGDFARARSTFQRLLGLDPPPQVKAQLQAFLELTEPSATASPGPKGLSYQAYLAALVGRSTNVNQAPSQSVIFVPGVGSNFQLPGQNVKLPDSFVGVSGGIDLSLPLGGAYSIIAGGDFLDHRNFHETDFDVGGYNLYLGLSALSGPHLLKVQGVFGRDYLGGSPNRNLDGVSLSYVNTLNAATQFLATAQGGRQRYVPDEFKTFDADYAVLGAGASRKLGDRSTVFAILSAGHQTDIGGSPDGGRNLVGIQAGGEIVLGPRLKATAVVAGERSLYDEYNLAFQTVRHDNRRAFEIGAQYFLQQDLSLRLSLSHAYNDSNIPIYEYTRTEGTMMLRRDFR